LALNSATQNLQIVMKLNKHSIVQTTAQTIFAFILTLALPASASADENRPLDLSVVVGSFSNHLTDDFEPAGDYNETHQSLGLDIEKNVKTGWVPGATLFSFKDSFGNSSFTALGTIAYKKTFHPNFNIKGGLAAGFVDTSYYSGGVASPYVEACYYFVCPQLSYFPKISGHADSFIALQFKFKILGGLYK